MTDPRFQNSDLEEFAEYLGIDGLDFDVFYETYYELQQEVQEYDDYELAWEQAECIEMPWVKSITK